MTHPDDLELREVVAIGPPGGTFTPGDYPWLVSVRVLARGADGGPAGEDGYVLLELYARREDGQA